MNKRIYVVSGFSGVGKDTVLEKVTNIEKCVMKDNSTLWYSRSDTTRAPRNDADRYTFISKKEFSKRAADGYYLEMNTYGTGELYGTPMQPIIDSQGIVIIQVDVKGMHQIMHNSRLKGIPITTTFIATDADNLFYRLQHRGDDPSEIITRLKTAAEEAHHVTEYDYTLMNCDADATAVKLWSILHGLPASGDMFNTLKFIDAINEYIK